MILPGVGDHPSPASGSDQVRSDCSWNAESNPERPSRNAGFAAAFFRWHVPL